MFCTLSVSSQVEGKAVILDEGKNNCMTLSAICMAGMFLVSKQSFILQAMVTVLWGNE